MVERQQSKEWEEELHLDGYGGIEENTDMMNDEDLVAAADEYGKSREKFSEDEQEVSYGDGGYMDDDADGDGGDCGRHEKVWNLEDGVPEKLEGGGQEAEKRIEVKNEEESRKWKELLAFPPHGSEVFIGGLPCNISEKDLLELVEPFGDIFEVRVIKDEGTNESKGFAFIMFTNSDAAQNAVESIHAKEFNGRVLRCSLSQAKNRLLIRNVPTSLTSETLRKILEDSSPGVEHIEMFMNQPYNRGFLLVDYYNHACAEYARQRFTNPTFTIDGIKPTVRWAWPHHRNWPDPSAAAQVKAIHVRNLPENVSTERLKELFEQNGEVRRVDLLPPKLGQAKRDFCFIHFSERSSALKALKATQRYEIDGHVLEISLARPQANKHVHATKSSCMRNVSRRHYSYPEHLCGAYCGAYTATGFGQPILYGRGPMPAGMKLVPVMLSDGRVGYVLQQTGAPHSRSATLSSGSSERRRRGGDEKHGRRNCPY